METAPTISMGQLPDFLLHVATVTPVHVWGPPGIGKSAVIEQFARKLGMECVSLLGSQLAPEDLIGVPRFTEVTMQDGTKVFRSEFAPPKNIARANEFVLFLDELNGSSPDVQKAFYSLIHEKRLGDYYLPQGTIIIAAGNRASDNAIVRQMSSALVNRMAHVTVTADTEAWLAWAVEAAIHPLVYEFVQQHPRMLLAKPPKEERTFSTPRAWDLLSKMLHSYGDANLNVPLIRTLSESVLTPEHAQIFTTWYKNADQQFVLNHIIKGERGWPEKPEDRDLLHYLSLRFRDQLIKELPVNPEQVSNGTRKLVTRGLELLRSLADLAPELAQMVIVADDQGRSLPDWFMIEVGDELPQLVARHKPQKGR